MRAVFELLCVTLWHSDFSDFLCLVLLRIWYLANLSLVYWPFEKGDVWTVVCYLVAKWFFWLFVFGFSEDLVPRKSFACLLAFWRSEGCSTSNLPEGRWTDVELCRIRISYISLFLGNFWGQLVLPSWSVLGIQAFCKALVVPVCW